MGTSLFFSKNPFLGLPTLELASICINLTLLLVFLFTVAARLIHTRVGRIQTFKESFNSNTASISARNTADCEIQIREIGTGYKASVFCCFYVLFLQVMVLVFDGVGLIRDGKGSTFTNWVLLVLPASQGLAWSVLSFSALGCKFRASEKYPLLLRVWWVVSFITCLCTLYVDGKQIIFSRHDFRVDCVENKPGDNFGAIEVIITFGFPGLV